MSGRVLYVRGGELRVMEGWRHGPVLEHDGPRTVADCGRALNDLA